MIDSDRILGALILGGAADALGWRNESWKPTSKRKPVANRLESWSKRIGRVGGFWESIEAGEYSDDTQLTLAVARCVSPDGRYDADRFAQVEFPYWLSYQRGGGRTIKRAAANLRSDQRLTWDSNCFEGYKDAGANGAAMRVLALAVIEGIQELTVAAWQNAITSHGHPRGVIGALVMARGLAYTLRVGSFRPSEYVKCLHEFIEQMDPDLPHERLRRWVHEMSHVGFRESFKAAKAEMLEFMERVWTDLHVEDEQMLSTLGCFRAGTKGSGTATVAAGNFFFLKYNNAPLQGIVQAANAYGADTDTIGKFAGNLLGALHGRAAYENELTEPVQDRTYFDRISNYLAGRESAHWNGNTGEETVISEATKEGDSYYSAVLGFGEVVRVVPPRVINQGQERLFEVKVAFECGQTCYFNRRVPIRHNRSTSSLFALDE
jgi:ADP-ribosylglycohydrolase